MLAPGVHAVWLIQGGAGACTGVFLGQGSSQGSMFPVLPAATNQRHTLLRPQVTPCHPRPGLGSRRHAPAQPSGQSLYLGPTNNFQFKRSGRLSWHLWKPNSLLGKAPFLLPEPSLQLARAAARGTQRLGVLTVGS